MNYDNYLQSWQLLRIKEDSRRYWLTQARHALRHGKDIEVIDSLKVVEQLQKDIEILYDTCKPIT